LQVIHTLLLDKQVLGSQPAATQSAPPDCSKMMKIQSVVLVLCVGAVFGEFLRKTHAVAWWQLQICHAPPQRHGIMGLIRLISASMFEKQR
jgi:hypothetical protein